VCKWEDDPNGIQAKKIYDLLLEKAQEGNIASEVVDFMEEKVLEARRNLAKQS